MNEYDVYNEYLEFEEKHNFFDIEYKGIRIWDYTRYYFHKLVNTNIIGLFNPSTYPAVPKDTQINDFIKERQIDINSLNHYDIVLMGDPRRVKQSDGFYYDIYTDYLPDILDNYSCITIEDPFWSQFPLNKETHRTPAITQNLLYTDKIVKNFYEALFDENSLVQEKKDLEKIYNEITNKFLTKYKYDFDVAIKNSMAIALFLIYTEDIYCDILKKINPKAVLSLLHPNPSCMAFLHCAKKLNIPIAEIQHGIIGEFEPIWHKFKDPTKKYELPDFILSPSSKLTLQNDMALTEQNNQIKVVGYPFLESKIKQYENMEEDKTKNILFISQTNIGGTLCEFASELAELLKDKPEYHILYKLHPFELNKKYPCLDKDNITVINNLEKDVYYYAKKSQVQIGVYSTAIYEAIQFGLTTIIADEIMGSKEAIKILDGIEGVYSALTPKQAYDIIINNPKVSNSNNNLWPKVDKQQYKNVIEEIIKSKK